MPPTIANQMLRGGTSELLARVSAARRHLGSSVLPYVYDLADEADGVGRTVREYVVEAERALREAELHLAAAEGGHEQPLSSTVRCSACGRLVRRHERGWRAYLVPEDEDGRTELAVYCPSCAAGELAD